MAFFMSCGAGGGAGDCRRIRRSLGGCSPLPGWAALGKRSNCAKHLVPGTQLFPPTGSPPACFPHPPPPQVFVSPGQEVCEGETLLVIEAMKMELPVKAPCSGTGGDLVLVLPVKAPCSGTHGDPGMDL